MDYDGVSALIENMTSKYGDMSVIKASIELHEHKEQSRASRVSSPLPRRSMNTKNSLGARTDSAGD